MPLEESARALAERALRGERLATRHEAWDAWWWLVCQDALADGLSRDEARAVADRQTELEFGPRPS
jgi:hypothetical protein